MNESTEQVKTRSVYLVTDGEFIKIGCSGDVEARVKTLQTSNARRLRLLTSFPGGHDVEAKLHTRFASKRRLGEWFDLAPADVGWVIDNYGFSGTYDEGLLKVCHDFRQNRQGQVYASLTRPELVEKLDSLDAQHEALKVKSDGWCQSFNERAEAFALVSQVVLGFWSTHGMGGLEPKMQDVHNFLHNLRRALTKYQHILNFYPILVHDEAA